MATPIITEVQAARFWAMVRKGKPGECWEWTGFRSRGYGKITSGGDVYRSHRFSWFLHSGDIPDGMCVCHKCDNPGCVNPDHLFLGTMADNVDDRDRKCRRKPLRGGQNPFATMTDGMAKIVYGMANLPGMNCIMLARAIGVGHSVVLRIKNRQTYAHIHTTPR